MINKRIHIIGHKNSGKTTLIVELVRELTARGLRVGTIKHTHHHHELDTPGKDSHRHREAGAAKVGIMAPGMNALFWPPGEDCVDGYQQMMPMFDDCDLVLVEGHARGPGLKVEVWRNAINGDPMASIDGTVAAIVTDDALAVPTPTWSRSDVAAIAQRIMKLISVEA